MKASQFTVAPVAAICRKAGISQATYFNWKKKHAGMMPSEMRRVRELEQENARLKKIVESTANRALQRGQRQSHTQARKAAKANRTPFGIPGRHNLRERDVGPEAGLTVSVNGCHPRIRTNIDGRRKGKIALLQF